MYQKWHLVASGFHSFAAVAAIEPSPCIESTISEPEYTDTQTSGTYESTHFTPVNPTVPPHTDPATAHTHPRLRDGIITTRPLYSLHTHTSNENSITTTNQPWTYAYTGAQHDNNNRSAHSNTGDPTEQQTSDSHNDNHQPQGH